jgi:hypothetical protein
MSKFKVKSCWDETESVKSEPNSLERFSALNKEKFKLNSSSTNSDNVNIESKGVIEIDLTASEQNECKENSRPALIKQNASCARSVVSLKTDAIVKSNTKITEFFTKFQYVNSNKFTK